MKPFLLLIISVLTLISCDCMNVMTGIVVDAETDKPLRGAYVQNFDKSNCYIFTDDDGMFELHTISGICTPMKLMATKEGYNIAYIEPNRKDSVIIKLSKVTYGTSSK